MHLVFCAEIRGRGVWVISNINNNLQWGLFPQRLPDHPAIHYGLSEVLGLRGPFEIRNTVVGLVVVQVHYRLFPLGVWEEYLRHHTVNRNLRNLTVCVSTSIT